MAVSLCVYLKISFYEPISCRMRLSKLEQPFNRSVSGDQINEKKAIVDVRRCSYIEEACGQTNASRKNRPHFEAY
jgi:hypothetical protein